jgi:heavy metal translocating P-type ATPase
MTASPSSIAKTALSRPARSAVSALALCLSLAGIMLPHGIDPAFAAVILCGIPIAAESARALWKDRDITADLMVTLALAGSLAAGQWFAAGEVAFIMELGSMLEDFSAMRARKSIRSLASSMPDTAIVRRGGMESEIPASGIRPGDIVIVLPGSAVPTDGVLESANASVDQSSITGESFPVDLEKGAKVAGGTVNAAGAFEYRATAAARDSTLQRMARLAEEAGRKRAPIERMADKWASWLVVATVLFALASFAVNALALGDSSKAFMRAVSVLVVVCPCAFVLATPTAVAAGIANAARHGMLLKTGAAMERFAAVGAVAFDKTGTITRGEPGIVSVKAFDGFTNDQVLSMAASAERRSEHPLGKAIARACPGAPAPESSEVFPGGGVAASCGGIAVAAGSASFLEKRGIAIDAAKSEAAPGTTMVFVAADGRAAGAIALSDAIRPEAPRAVEMLGKMGIGAAMLTGDAMPAASAAAMKAGIASVRAGLLPEGKMEAIRELQAGGRRVCMVGDGINDAVALRCADASIAMGGIGSDLAAQSADAVLAAGSLCAIPRLLAFSRRVRGKIFSNIAISLTLNATAAVLASTGVLDPVSGALVHNAGSVFVVVNSITLLRSKAWDGAGGTKASENNAGGI